MCLSLSQEIFIHFWYNKVSIHGGVPLASTQQYLDLILYQLQGLGQVNMFRNMLGEYLLYYRGRLFGGIYDNRLLLKSVQPALDFFENPVYEFPYPGAKPMLRIKEVEDAAFLCNLIEAAYPALPASKKKR